MCGPEQRSPYTDYGTGESPRIRGSIPGRGKRCFSSTKLPDQLWASPRILFNGCWGLSPSGKEAGESS